MSAMSTTAILLVEDDEATSQAVTESLTRAGFTVTCAHDAEDALIRIEHSAPAMIVLDVGLPGMTGLQLLRRLRNSDTAASRLPVIMLSGESGESDRIRGLELGADDYVCKPFSPGELAARIRTVLRRSEPSSRPKLSAFVRGKLTIDSDHHSVTYAGQTIALTATEFRIVDVLARQAGKLLSREAIHESVHGTPALPDDRSIDAHIKSIRRKLADGGEEIETVRGFGYRWR